MPVNPVWHGSQFASFPNEVLPGHASGQFTVTAAAVTTITDANVVSGSSIVVVPANGAAGLLFASKSCFVTTGVGSFTFNVSATGAGAPAGTELFNYVALNTTYP